MAFWSMLVGAPDLATIIALFVHPVACGTPLMTIGYCI